ncbi:MAG: hypothetical protein E7326_02470 [Clostridiales bacterium]|nr:hypothetical protein [Clostridiales bacterium]
MNLFRTTTEVHSQPAQLHQRWEAYVSDQYKLSALCLLALLWLSHSLFLADRVSTPSYLSVLLFLMPLAVLHGVCLFLSRRAEGGSTLTALLPRFLGRGMECLIGLSLLCDAVFLLCGLASLLGEMLPALRRYMIVPLIGAFCFLSMLRNKHFALLRLSGFLFLPLLIGIFLSAAPALKEGHFHHFFPLLGSGPASIGKGALWLCGNLGCACLPLLIPGEKESLSRMRQKGKRRGGGFLFLLSLYALLVIAMYTYLLPPYALTEQLSMGERLLLPVQISSSVPGWSLYVCSLILLLLVCYTGLISRSAAFLHGSCTKEDHPSDLLILVLILLSLPCAFFYAHDVQDYLVLLLPYRALPYLAALTLASIGALIKAGKRRKTA